MAHMVMQPVTILDPEEMRRALTRIAHQILEAHAGVQSLALVGVQTRGVPLAARIAGLIERFEGKKVPVLELDVTPYRDDRPPGSALPPARPAPLPVQGLSLVLVDDVFYTGRTVRAAVDALMDMGRPARIQLAVLVDRGHRELPFRADYVGKSLPTSRHERVHVRLVETDGVDEVVLVRPDEA